MRLTQPCQRCKPWPLLPVLLQIKARATLACLSCAQEFRYSESASTGVASVYTLTFCQKPSALTCPAWHVQGEEGTSTEVQAVCSQSEHTEMMLALAMLPISTISRQPLRQVFITDVFITDRQSSLQLTRSSLKAAQLHTKHILFRTSLQRAYVNSSSKERGCCSCCMQQLAAAAEIPICLAIRFWGFGQCRTKARMLQVLQHCHSLRFALVCC